MPPTRRRESRFPEWWNTNADQRYDLAYRGIFTTRDMRVAANKLTECVTQVSICLTCCFSRFHERRPRIFGQDFHKSVNRLKSNQNCV